MRFLSLLFVVALVSCGSEGPDKTGSSESNGTNNGGASNNGGSTSGSSTNNTTGSASNNGMGSTGSTSGKVSCEVISSDVDTSYCNLQALCDAQELYVECQGGMGAWDCYCGDQVTELAENPCETPDTSAPELAVSCGLATGGM